MQSTMQLYHKAMAQTPSAKFWCDQLNVSRNTLAVAKIRGRLSPTVAGNLARLLGEDVKTWIAISAIEGEPESYAKNKIQTVANEWLHSSLVLRKRRAKKQRIRRYGAFFTSGVWLLRYAVTIGASRLTLGALGLSCRQITRQMLDSLDWKMSASSGMVKSRVL